MTKIKSISKRSVALILAILMALSCGIISAVAANVELAATGVNIAKGTTLYLNTGGSSLWNQGNAWFAMYLYGDGEAWVKMTDSDGDGIYEGTVTTDNNYTNVIFVRKNPSNTELDWNDVWNQTENLSYDDTNNCYKITAWSVNTNICSGNWYTYTPTTPTAVFSAGDVVYLDVQNNTGWQNSTAKMYVQFNESTSGDITNRAEMTQIGTYLYKYTFTSDCYSSIRFWRGNSSNMWNYSNTLDSSKNGIMIDSNGWNNSGTSYTFTMKGLSSPTLTVSSASIDLGNSTTLTSSAAFLNYIVGSTAYTTTPTDAKYTFSAGSDQLSSSTSQTYTWTPTAAGEYSVTAKVSSANLNLSAESTAKTVTVSTPNYSYSVVADEGGTVTPTEAGTVAPGESISITATPNEGYNFTGWTVENGTVADASALSTNFTPTANGAKATANFLIKTYTVTFKDYDGSVLKETTVNHGSSVTAPTASRTGYTFTGWSGGDYTNVTSDMTLTAEYTINSYTVKFEDYDGTQIGVTQTVEYNEMPTPPADPTREGYTFKEWSPQVDVATKDVTYKATYTANLYDVTTTYDSTQGTVTVTGLKDVKAEYDSEITVTATPKDGYRLKSLTVTNAGTTEAGTTFTVKGDVTVTAEFEAIVYKTVTVNEVGGTGTVTSTEGGTISGKTVTAEQGTALTVTVTAPTGYYVSSFNGVANTNESKTSESLEIASLDEDMTLEVVYTKKSTYTVTVVNSNSDAGTYATEGSLIDLQAGSTVKITATANSGWSFKSFTVNGVEKTDNPTTVTVTADTTVQINWEEVSWKGYIYVEDRASNSSIYCYAWSGSGSAKTDAFPGNKMTKVGTSDSGYPVYAIYLDFSADTVKNRSAKFILSGGSNDTKYTDDITIQTDKNYYILSSSGLTVDRFVSADPNLPITVYLDNGANKKDGSNQDTIGLTTVDTNENGVDSISELKKQTADTGNYDTGYYKASVNKNTPVTVTCTVQDSNYKVEGFVINATEYVKASNMGGGKYQITYSFTEEDTVVVPIYYYTDAYIAEKNIDMITVYAIGDGSIDGWGDYMAAYTWYERSNSTYYGQGSWPGQIMVPVTGAENLYEIKVPATAPDGTPVSGITFSNYGGWPNVAGYMYPVTNTKNLQVYDYYEFVTLANQGSDNITFVLKQGNDDNNPQAKDTSAPDSSYYVDYVNFSGAPIDILNIKLSEEAANESPSLYIIHQAPVGDYTAPLNGKYYVDCYVYTATGKYLGTFKSYKFLELNYDDTTITNTDGVDVDFKNYYGKRVMVDYETHILTDNATRYDGQWYGEALTVELAVNVGLMNDSGSYTVTANTPANDDIYGFANVNGGVVETVSRGKEVTLSATAKSGYKFVGWYYSGTDTCFATTTTTTVSAVVDATYTAVFKELANGEFVVTHEIYNGGGTSSYIPDAHGGRANLYIGIVNNTTNETAPFSLTGQASVSATVGDELVITIATDALGADRFFAWYIDAKDKYGLTTYEEVGVDNYDSGLYGNIYDNSQNGIDTVIGSNDMVYYQFKYTVKENVFNIALYSDLVPVSVDTTLVYNYNNRYGEVKTYSVKYTLTDEEIAGCEGNGYKPYTPTNETIITHAPYVEDLYKDTSWIMTDSLYDNTLFELWATQPNTVYNVNVNIGGHSKTYSGEFNTEIQIKGKDLDRTATNTGFWFEDVNNDGEYTEGVDRILSYGTYYGLRITKDMYIYYQQVENLDFDITIDEPVYGREQTTDSSVADKDKDFIYIDYLTTLLVPYFKGDTVNGEKITNVTYGGETITTTNTSVTIETLENLGYTFDYGIILEQLKTDVVNTDWGKVVTSDDVLKNVLVNGNGWNDETTKTKYCTAYSAVGAYDLTNKNRLLYTFTMLNTEKNQGKYYNVYGYLVVTDPSGNTNYYFSNMQTLNILEIGTSAGSNQTGNE